MAITNISTDMGGISDRLFTYFYPIVDHSYDRANVLLAHGLRLFQYDQEFIREVSDGDENAVEEQKQWELFFSKFQLSRERYQAKEFFEGLKLRRQRVAETGNHWEGQPTIYHRRFEQLFTENDQSRTALITLQNEFNRKIWGAWGIEQAQHVGDEHGRYAGTSVEIVKRFTKDLLEDKLSPLGFCYDKKLTKKNALVYSKNIYANWFIFLAIDLIALTVPIKGTGHRYSSDSIGRISLGLGPDLELWFGLIDRARAKSLTLHNDDVLLLKPEWFLPIRKAPLWSRYSQFYSLLELEALININLIFYQTISAEIEAAVAKAFSGA